MVGGGGNARDGCSACKEMQGMGAREGAMKEQLLGSVGAVETEACLGMFSSRTGGRQAGGVPHWRGSVGHSAPGRVVNHPPPNPRLDLGLCGVERRRVAGLDPAPGGGSEGGASAQIRNAIAAHPAAAAPSSCGLRAEVLAVRGLGCHDGGYPAGGRLPRQQRSGQPRVVLPI